MCRKCEKNNEPRPFYFEKNNEPRPFYFGKNISILCFIFGIIFSLILLITNNKKYISIEEQIKKTKKVDEYKYYEIGHNINTMYDNFKTVRFGKYYYDKNKKMSDIEWYVLDTKDGLALLLSKYIIDSQEMCKTVDNKNQWNNSYLRNWLNNDFYYIAFNDEEREKIVPCELENVNIPLSLHEKQEKTEDNVFILTYEELKTYFVQSDRLATAATEYVYSKGDLVNMQGEKFNELASELKNEYQREGIKLNLPSITTSEYWTRTFKDENCLTIDFRSFLTEFNKNNRINDKKGVRPAIWIYYDNDIFINKIVKYELFKKDPNLEEPNIEYDLSKTPGQLQLVTRGEKNAYFKQFIEKKLKPDKLKKFIDIDQLQKFNYGNYEQMCDDIKEKAFFNVVTKLLEEDIDLTKLPVTEKYIKEYKNLREKLNIASDNYKISNGSFHNGRLGNICFGLYLTLLNDSGKRKKEFYLEFYFDDSGAIDKINII